jgi:putative FmdB family regulatory protein
MPIYEYKCTNGHVFEVMQSFSDEPLSQCQECGAPVQKVFHPVAIHFKGPGFHNTDYGTRKRAREKEASSASANGSSGESSSSSDSSPSSTTSGATSGSTSSAAAD